MLSVPWYLFVFWYLVDIHLVFSYLGTIDNHESLVGLCAELIFETAGRGLAYNDKELASLEEAQQTVSSGKAKDNSRVAFNVLRIL